MIDMTNHPSMIRNVMVGGHIHHGKTSLLDMLVFETHQLTFDADQPVSPLGFIPQRIKLM
jgi:U5 small nuclear ribonucleoprotein component